MKKYSLFLILVLSVVFVAESLAQSAREKKKMERRLKKLKSMYKIQLLTIS
ncbi:MAG: hypothetical protein L3J29_07485 [Cyclobacteriaceae bacterium]|nr:hypothetical protein [Cyclobacteriaceae bacterium]